MAVVRFGTGKSSGAIADSMKQESARTGLGADHRGRKRSFEGAPKWVFIANLLLLLLQGQSLVVTPEGSGAIAQGG